jgi:hypothetical protein
MFPEKDELLREAGKGTSCSIVGIKGRRKPIP